VRGTGLRELLDETRHDAAREMLAHTSLDVGQIAESLGYARTSVWRGIVPAGSGFT
jgi:AraC-like DNA-binding protein